MFLKKLTTKSIENYSDNINRLKNEIETADAILIGAGAGMSTSSGFTYDGERFLQYFSDFHHKYGISDMYSGGFYSYETPEEYWAWWSRQIWFNRYDAPTGKTYIQLLELVKGKDYFVITTNVDHQFQKADFDKKRLFYTQGDYGLWQCADGCGNKTYDNKEQVQLMIAKQKNMKIPTELIPLCLLCGKPMTMNLRCDNNFVEDDGWYAAKNRYKLFLGRHKTSHILYLELGVGSNTPDIIKYPFWKMTMENPNAVYACINNGESECPSEIARQSLCFDSDIAEILSLL